jgi:hypothetical protein
MDTTSLMSIVEDIFSEGSNIWNQPTVYRNATEADKELKKFPSKLQKYFKVAPDATRPAGILTTDEFHKKAKKVNKSTFELDGFEIGIEDGKIATYVKR